jgi:uncharacterized protein involved in type VI secretion and phage assembly
MGAPDLALPYGLWHAHYLAEVVDLNDPDSIGRVQVRLLSFDGVAGQDAPLWARIALPFAGSNRGTYFMPDVGDEVLVSFLNGDPRHPVVIGGLWNGQASPPESMDGQSKNYLKVIRSRNGVKVTLDDHDGQEKLVLETPGGQKVTLKDGPGAVEIVDSNGNSIKLESAGITVQASAEVKVQAATVKVSAGMVTVDAGMSKFSGVVKCDTLIATTVVSSTYTPGAGNIW